MSLDLATSSQDLLENYDRRRYRRYELTLFGRYMLESRREYPCQTIDISSDSLALTAPVKGRIGERIIAYIDQVGRIEGEVTRLFDNGFGMTIHATLRKRDKLAATLTWLMDRDPSRTTEDRRNGRVVPKNPFSRIALPDGEHHRCRLIDLSFSGAAIAVAVKPPIGTPVALGRIGARIARHLDDGVAVEFTTPQSEETLREHF